MDHFAVESKTIIRTKDSRENGAVFLNETEVKTELVLAHQKESILGNVRPPDLIILINKNEFVALISTF